MFNDLGIGPITILTLLIGGGLALLVGVHLYAHWTIRNIDRDRQGPVRIPISTSNPTNAGTGREAPSPLDPSVGEAWASPPR